MALLLCADNLSVSFGLQPIFTIQSLEIHDGDRIGIVGTNGSGKSTLLSTLHGDREPDQGTVMRYTQSAIIRQFDYDAASVPSDAAIQSKLHAKDAIHEGISGGELERFRISYALSKRAPLLFADEPTTNLDFEGIATLQQMLFQYEGALLLVSHDRALLDALCRDIWELDKGELYVYHGNYSAYKRQKKEQYDRQLFEYTQYRAEQSRLQTSIRDVKSTSQSVRKAPKRMGNSEARLHKRGGGAAAKKQLDKNASALQSRLEKLEVKTRPRENQAIRIAPSASTFITSSVAARVEHLTVRAGSKTLLRDVSFALPTGQRTVLMGPNGSGKTSLLRALCAMPPSVRLSPGIKLGVFEQSTMEKLDPERTLLENVLQNSILPEHQVRTILARMGLSALDMTKSAQVLSGGERAKTSLACLLTSDVNLLLLDEPTNHLDLSTLEALEEMLITYGGTLLLVTHDRHMINTVAENLLILQDGEVVWFAGNLAAWEAHGDTQKDDGLNIEIIRMRMAALLGQLSAPRQKKGTNREKIEAEYDALQNQLQLLQKRNKA